MKINNSDKKKNIDNLHNRFWSLKPSLEEEEVEHKPAWSNYVLDLKEPLPSLSRAIVDIVPGTWISSFTIAFRSETAQR